VKICCSVFLATFPSPSYVEIFIELFEGFSWIVTSLQLSMQVNTRKTTIYKPKMCDMLNIKSMKQPFKTLFSEKGDKKFLQNAGYSVRYCLPWQFRRWYCTPV